MDVISRFGRRLSAVFLLLGVLACACTASAQPAAPRTIATAAAVKRVKAETAAADRRSRQLRLVARRACASPHKRALCRRSRRMLSRAEAAAARLRKALRQPPSWQRLPTSSGASTDSRTPAGPGIAESAGGSGSAGSTAPPSASSALSSSSFQPGIDSGMEASDLAGTALLGAKLVRIEWPINTPAAQLQSAIASYAAKGVRVLPLASFRGRLPTSAEAQALASWAKAYGPNGTFWAGRTDGSLAIQSIEFGNETSYGYQYGDSAGTASYQERARNYALRFKEAAQAVAATGTSVGLLAQADDWTGDWVNGMYAAVPDLSAYVAGWVIHPYGTNWRARLNDLISQTAAHGAPATIPVDITEWGVSTDNGACLDDNSNFNKCMSYEEAAQTLNSVSREIRQLLGSRLGDFVLYQIRDQKPTGATTDSEMYFGALQHELQPKGTYTTAVKSLLSSS
jgi:hypothetical protein